MNYIYPTSLLTVLKEKWAHFKPWGRKQALPPLPEDSALEQLLAVTYHASFMREEGRALGFRIIAYPRSHFKEEEVSPHRTQRCAAFSEMRPFSVAELRRLAPAAESIRSIICVDLDEKSNWHIWGLLDTGSNWWEFIHHEVSGGHPPPLYLTVSSSNPGELLIRA